MEGGQPPRPKAQANPAGRRRVTSRAELELLKAEIAYRVAHAQLSAAIGCE